MNDLQLLVDLHAPNPRQGPGSDLHTRRALELSGLPGRTNLKIADLGCGTGASTCVLAEALEQPDITAVDLFPEFLRELNARAQSRKLQDRITTHEGSFAELPFEPESFDAIWSEGAIYNLGFEAGVVAWAPLLKPGGVLAVSELTWLTAERPAELHEHWMAEYPEVDTAAGKMVVLERQGLIPMGYFPLPESCWLAEYYGPLEARFSGFLEEQSHSEAAQACVKAHRAEAAFYERYKAYVSYGFYVARKGPGASA